MFVLFNPGEERSTAHKLAATERDSRNSRAAKYPTGDGFYDMRLRAVQQLGYIGECQKIEII